MKMNQIRFWALYIYNHFEYFASEMIKVLLKGQETEARILDEWRWLCADSCLKSPKLEFPKALHRFQRILFFPDTPNLLQHWLDQWIELEWLEKREHHLAAARHLFPEEDLVLAPGVPVFVEVLEPGQVYALYPKKETYARIGSSP